mgnify:CR=1 FL=1
MVANQLNMSEWTSIGRDWPLMKKTNAEDVKIGNTVIWNGGSTSKVVGIEPRGGASVKLIFEDNGLKHTRVKRKTSYMVVLENQPLEVKKEFDLFHTMKEMANKIITENIEKLEKEGKPLFKSTQWRHKVTGEITTVLNLSEMKNYEEIKDPEYDRIH